MERPLPRSGDWVDTATVDRGRASTITTRRTRNGDHQLATRGDLNWPPVGTFPWPRTERVLVVLAPAAGTRRSPADQTDAGTGTPEQDVRQADVHSVAARAHGTAGKSQCLYPICSGTTLRSLQPGASVVRHLDAANGCPPFVQDAALPLTVRNSSRPPTHPSPHRVGIKSRSSLRLGHTRRFQGRELGVYLTRLDC